MSAHRTIAVVVVALTLATAIRADEPAVDRYGDPLPADALARLGMRSGTTRCEPAFSADGKTLATADGAHVLLWDVAAGKVVRRIAVDPFQMIDGLALTPGGRLVTYGHEGLRLWDVATGRLLDEQKKVPPRWAGAAFSPEGALLATTTAHPPGRNRLSVWEVATGKQLFDTEEDYPSVFFSADGKLVVTSSIRREKKPPYTLVHFRDARTGKLVRSFDLPDQQTILTDVSPDGKVLVGFTYLPHAEQAKWANLLRLFDATTGKERRVLQRLPSGDLKRARFSPDGKRIAAVDGDQRLALWEAATGKRVHSLDNAKEFFNHLAFSPDGKTLVQIGGSGRVHTYDVTTGRGRCLNPGHWARVMCLAFSPDGKRLASAGADGQVLEWDVAARAIRARVPAEKTADGQPRRVAQEMAYAPDGRHLLVKWGDQSVGLLDLRRGTEVKAFRAGGMVHSFTPDGRSLLWTGKLLDPVRLRQPRPGERLRPRDIEVWCGAALWLGASLVHPELQQFRPVAWFAPEPTEPPFPQPLLILDGARGDVLRPMLLSPDGRVVAEMVSTLTGSPFTGMGQYWTLSRYRLTEARTGREIASLSLRTHLHPLAFTRDGRALITTGSQGLTLVETRTGKPRRTLGAANIGPAGIALSPDGRWLAWLEGGAIASFDLARGRKTGTFKSDGAAPSCLAFAPDGAILASGALDGTILLWDTRSLADNDPPPPDWDDAEAARLWDDLASADGAKAYRAMTHLKTNPARAVRLIQRRSGWDDLARTAPRLANNLNSGVFAARQKAMHGLETLGERARPFLQKALVQEKSLEHRRRLEALLTKLGRPFSSPAGLRMLRAVEVLEQLGTPEAIAFLRRLADGPDADPLADEARRSLGRMAK